MKAVVYQEPKNICFKEMPIPKLAAGEVMIQVAYSGICGTDLHIFSGKHQRVKPPLIMGHEFSGTLVECQDKNIGALAIGQHVVAMPYISCGRCKPCADGSPHVCKSLEVIGVDRDGGFAEYVNVPFENVLPLEDSIPLKRGALIEPLAVGIHIINRAKIQLGDVALVMGCGPIGLMIAFLLKKMGNQQIILSEINPFRIQKARELGFVVVNTENVNLFDFIMQKTNDNGADIVFEVAGVNETISKVVQLTRPHGKIMLVGAHKEPPRIDIRNAVFKELVFLTSRVASKRDFMTATQMMACEEAAILENIITHEFSINEGQTAFEIAENHNKNKFKILFKNQ